VHDSTKSQEVTLGTIRWKNIAKKAFT